MRGVAIAVLGWAASLAGAQHQAEVLELLRSSDWKSAQQRILLDHDSLTPDVIAALKHEDAKVRARAAEVLRVVDSQGQVHPDPTQVGLGRRRKTAVAALLLAAKDPDVEAHKQVIWALAYLLRNREFGVHGEPNSDPKEVDPIIALGRAATQPLRQLLARGGQPDPDLRGAKIAALRVLRSTRDPRALDDLLDWVKVAQGFLLHEGMLTLAAYDDPRVVRAIVDSIDVDIPDFGSTPGMWVIEQLLKGRAIPDLIRAVVNHPRASVRELSARMLMTLPDKRSIKALQKATGDLDAAVRRQAAYALGANIDRSNVPVLRKLLKDPDQKVREAATESLNIHTNS